MRKYRPLNLAFVLLSFQIILSISSPAGAEQIPRATNMVFLVDPSPSMFVPETSDALTKASEAKKIMYRMNAWMPDLGYAVLLPLPYLDKVIGPATYERQAFRNMISNLSETLSPVQKQRTHSLDSALLKLHTVLSRLEDKISVIILSTGQTDQEKVIDAVGQLLAKTPAISFPIVSLADDAAGRRTLEKVVEVNNGVFVDGARLMSDRAAMQQFVKDVFSLQVPKRPSRKDLAELDIRPVAGLTTGSPETPPFQFVLFDSKRYTINQAEMPYLVMNVVILKSMPQVLIQIGGHTDSTGRQSDNRRLSQKRARAVANELIRRGIPADRIKTVGYGESRPVLSNLTSMGRRLNRRVEIVILNK